MPNTKKNIKKIWVSDVSGRSIFGWKIKEEIFAIFFILVILALANDENIVKKVSDNIYIQIFVCLIVIYCIYNRIPWSLAFILILLVAILFSGFFTNVKCTVEKIIIDMKNKNQNTSVEDKKSDNNLMHLGAQVFGWFSKDKNNSNKSILKKVKFEKGKDRKDGKDGKKGTQVKREKGLGDIDSDSGSDGSEDSDDSDDEVCQKVSKMFGFSDDEGLSEVETDNETDNETEPDTDRENEEENLKNSLKTFMKEKMNM